MQEARLHDVMAHSGLNPVNHQQKFKPSSEGGIRFWWGMSQNPLSYVSRAQIECTEWEVRKCNALFIKRVHLFGFQNIKWASCLPGLAEEPGQGD